MSKSCSPAARRVHASGLHTFRCERATKPGSVPRFQSSWQHGASIQSRQHLTCSRSGHAATHQPTHGQHLHRRRHHHCHHHRQTSVRDTTTTKRKCAKVCEMPTRMTWCVHQNHEVKQMSKRCAIEIPHALQPYDSFRGSLKRTRAVSSIS